MWGFLLCKQLYKIPVMKAKIWRFLLCKQRYDGSWCICLGTAQPKEKHLTLVLIRYELGGVKTKLQYA